MQEELCGGLRWQQRHRRLEGKKQNDRRSPFASTRQTSIYLFLACKHVATVLQTLASVRRHIRHVEGGEAVKRCVVSLQAKFCSTVANDIMLDTGVGVVRMWADETSRLSRFRMLFTSFADRESFLPVAINLCHSAFVFRRTWSHVVAFNCRQFKKGLCYYQSRQHNARVASWGEKSSSRYENNVNSQTQS